MRLPGTQRGALLIVAVVLIAVAATMAAAMVALTAGSGQSGGSHLESGQALFIAESGLERGIRSQLSPVLAERVGCTAVTGDVNLTNIAFGEGRFTLTGGAASYPNNANNTLKAGIGVADVVIPLNDLTGFAATGGRVLIDREAIDYSGVSSDTTVCGGAASTPCLIGAQRGRDGTVAAAHANAARVGQFQCDLQSQGGVPDLAGSSRKRTLRTGVQIQEAWAVGNLGGSATTENLNAIHCVSASDCWAVADNGVLVHWNGSGWTQDTFVAAENLNGISCADANNCIAVGDNGTILRYNTGTWSSVGSTVTSDINSVHCTGATNCWAVADIYNPPGPGGDREVIYQWSGAGGAWSPQVALAGIPDENLNGIYCLDAANCFATGDNGTLLQFDGTWSDIGGGVTTENMNGVWCSTTSNCIAVGDNGTVLRWNGTSWSSTITPALLRWNGMTWSDTSGLLASGINRDLRAVTALSYTDGWVVGETGNDAVAPCLNNRARIGRWNGSSWACDATSPRNNNLNSVSAVSYNDAWAVGAGGSIVRWTGAAWGEQNAAQNITARELHAVQALNSTEIWATGRFETQGGKTCSNGTWAVILRWNGAWSCQNTGAATRRYRAMFMFPDGTDAGTLPDDGWIVGDRAGVDFSIFRWNNPVANQWNNQSFLDATNRERLNSVTMLDTDGDGLGDDGWAVGNARTSGGVTRVTIVRWNHPCVGGAATDAWAVCSFDPGAVALRQDLNAVSCVHARDCWAAGDNGLILHWDGASWTVHTQSGGMPGALTTANLNSISIIGPKTRPQAAWREIFP